MTTRDDHDDAQRSRTCRPSLLPTPSRRSRRWGPVRAWAAESECRFRVAARCPNQRATACSRCDPPGHTRTVPPRRPPSSRGGRRIAPHQSAAFAAFEFAVWASLYAAYLAVRGATIGSPEDALRNGREIVAAENALRIFHEARIQETLSALEWFFSAYYMVGFAPLIAITLVWLALRHEHRYRELRTALLVSISIATVVFVLFPAAPPRLIPDLGIADTVGLTSHDTGSFAGVRFNPYAAMPSMHVGWSLLVGLFGYRAARRRTTRTLFAAHPAVMVAAVMATGNHFVLDAVAGAAIAGAVVAVMRLAAVRRAAISAQTPHRNRRRRTCPSTAGVTATSILKKTRVYGSDRRAANADNCRRGEGPELGRPRPSSRSRMRWRSAPWSTTETRHFAPRSRAGDQTLVQRSRVFSPRSPEPRSRSDIHLTRGAEASIHRRSSATPDSASRGSQPAQPRRLLHRDGARLPGRISLRSRGQAWPPRGGRAPLLPGRVGGRAGRRAPSGRLRWSGRNSLIRMAPVCSRLPSPCPSCP